MPMAPRASSAPAPKSGRQHETDPLDVTPVVRPRQRAGTPNSERLQNKSPAFHAPHPQLVQASPTLLAPISEQVSTKRKRPQEASEAEADEPEGVCPSKQPRELTPSKDKLTKENLRIFNGEEMDFSRRSMTTASEVIQETTRTSSSSGTAAFYRYTHLRRAQVYIHVDPPADIQAAINRIVKVKPSDERRAQLKAISQVFHVGCNQAVKATHGDDCVGPFLDALRTMNHHKICLRTKSNWQEELKPKIQPWRSKFNFKLLTNIVASSSASQKKEDHSLTKTPKPHMSIGTERTSLVSALSSQGFDKTGIEQLLRELQNNMTSREPNGPQEPMLISDPSMFSGLVFPFGVVEGKAYSTDKGIFKAENQTAVSGACALKIQLCLDELARRAITNSDIEPIPSEDRTQLFFSVCIQGPYCELWAHWTSIEDDVRKFNQVLLEICHGVMLNYVEDFIVAVDNVLHWGTGPFLDSVVERLGKVAKRIGV